MQTSKKKTNKNALWQGCGHCPWSLGRWSSGCPGWGVETPGSTPLLLPRAAAGTRREGAGRGWGELAAAEQGLAAVIPASCLGQNCKTKGRGKKKCRVWYLCLHLLTPLAAGGLIRIALSSRWRSPGRASKRALFGARGEPTRRGRGSAPLPAPLGQSFPSQLLPAELPSESPAVRERRELRAQPRLGRKGKSRAAHKALRGAAAQIRGWVGGTQPRRDAPPRR